MSNSIFSKRNYDLIGVILLAALIMVVLPLTLERARRGGLRTHVLPTWFDVDTEADLLRLQREIATTPTGPLRSIAFVRALFAAGVFPGAIRPSTSPLS